VCFYHMSGVDFAGDTISIVHLRKTMIEDKQQHIAIVSIAEMI